MKWIVIILAALVLVGCVHNGLIGDYIGIASFACYALFPFFDTKRVRARWATFTILFTGLFGMAYASVVLMLHSEWLVVGSHANNVIHSYLSFFGGIILGTTLTLMISGQLPGPKRDD